MYFGVNASTRLFINTSGRVGIGTTSPQTFLHVSDGNTGTKLIIEDTYGGNGRWGLGAGIGGLNDTHFTLRHESSSTTVLVATPSGNVGIGTSNPGTQLNIVNATPTSSSLDAILDISNNIDSNFRILNTGSSASDKRAAIGTSTGTSLAFHTGNAEKMRITSGGNVCINTTTPIGSSRLTVVGQTAGGITGFFLDSPGDTSLYWYSFGNSIQIESRNAAGNVFRNICLAAPGGNVGIGMGGTQPSYRLQVNGGVAGVGGYVNWSDARLKKDVKPLVDSLKNILSLNGITYNWDKSSSTSINFDDENHIGLLAQDVEKILPQVVSTTKDNFGTKAIAYSDLVPVLIEAIKELNAKIEAK
jgi:hypothetical protein